LWDEIKAGTSLSSRPHGQNRLSLGKINLIYCQLKTGLDSEKQRQMKTTPFPWPLPSFQAQLPSFHPDSSASPTPSGTVGWGMGAAVSP